MYLNSLFYSLSFQAILTDQREGLQIQGNADNTGHKGLNAYTNTVIVNKYKNMVASWSKQ